MLKVSVIIPIYNKEKYLEESILSAINQTMDKNEYEIILINNGSTDGSKEICKKYVIDNNIRLINQENRGPGGSINTGLINSKGKYIYILHADDIMDKTLLENCFIEMEKNNLDFINFDYEILYDEIDKCEDELEIFSINSEEDIVSGKEFLIRNLWAGPEFARMFDRKFILDNELFFDESLSIVDYEAYPRMCLKAEKVKYINKILYTHRQNKYNDSNNLNELKFINTRQIALYKLFNLIDKNKKETVIRTTLVNYSIMEWHELIRNILLMKKLNIDILLNLAIEQFSDKYIQMYNCKYLTLDNHLYLSSTIESITGSLLKNFEFHKNFEVINKIVNYEVNSYKNKVLNEIPFSDKSILIGIYGLGNHTKEMLNYYRDNIGEIKAKIEFIDSIKGGKGEKFQGENVINVKDIKNYNFNCIVVSSASFEEQMINNLKENNVDNIPIYRFYEEIKYALFK